MKKYFCATLLLMLSFSANSKEMTLYIAPTLADCVGVVPMQCLKTKESLNDPHWQLFYSNIEGFEYQHGFYYQITVEATQRTNVPADASALQWRLIRVDSKIHTDALYLYYQTQQTKNTKHHK